MTPPTDIAAYIDWLLRGGRFDNSHRAPQPTREWVGLTDEEIEAIWRDVEVSDIYDCVLPLSRAIEQASKEKNT
jgi:hypothetical protein